MTTAPIQSNGASIPRIQASMVNLPTKWLDCPTSPDPVRCSKFHALRDAITSTQNVGESQRVPGKYLGPAKSIGLDMSGATAVYQDGKLVWERMAGLGDLFSSVLRRLRLEQRIKRWIERRYGSACGCHRRQAAWNRRFPFPVWLQSGIRLLLGP